MTVSNYTLKFKNGHSRIATKVTLDNGKVIKFQEKMSKKLAIINANFQIERGLI